MSHEIIQPTHFPRAKGFDNGILAQGRTLYVAGQIGWELDGAFAARDLPGQFARALDHVLDILRAAGGAPEDLVRMTVYVTDLAAYRASTRTIGEAWRARLGKHFPAMALVGVAGLVEPLALVEIEATAVIPDAR